MSPKDGDGGVLVLLDFLLSGTSSLGSLFPSAGIAVQQGGSPGSLTCSPQVPGLRPPSACSSRPGTLGPPGERGTQPGLLQAALPGLRSFIKLTGVAPSVFIFPWVERELLESGSGEAGVWRPPHSSPQRLLEAQALCAGVVREWTFCLALGSDRAGPCCRLGPGL